MTLPQPGGPVGARGEDHEKGAFTRAVGKRAGLLRERQGGCSSHLRLSITCPTGAHRSFYRVSPTGFSATAACSNTLTGC
jgi:hypothetical protein